MLGYARLQSLVSPLESFMPPFDMSREHKLPKGFLLLLLLQIPETPAIVYHQWRLLTPYS